MKNFLLLTLTLLFVTLSSWAQPPDINNSTWVGWTDKGSSIATGVYARGAKANDYQIFTTVFIYDNANPVPGTSSGFTAGHKIMAVGIRNNSGATGSPSVKFDPNNNSFSPSPDGTVNGQASFSGSCDLGDWVVNTSGGNPQEITIRSANPYTATNDYYLPNGGNWGGPGQPGFRGINPSTGVWKVFFDLDQMTAEFGLGGSRNIVGKPTLGAFGSTIAIAIGGLGGTEAVVQNIGIVQPVHLYSDNTFTTWLSDYSTIQAGINAAVAGNALRVDAGTYTEALVINKALTILGPNAAVSPNGGSRVAEAVIDLTGGSVIKIAADNIILKGFKIVNLNQQGAIESGGGLSGTTAAANVTIEKNIFDNLKGDAIYTSGSISNWTITDNKIQNVTTYTTGGSYGCGMGFWLGASNVTITNNTISNVSWEGIQFVCYVTPASNILVQNNTITNVAHSGMNIASNLNNVQILGNTITNANTTTTPNEGGMIIQGLGTVTNALISGNIISGSYNGIYVLTGFDLTGKGLLVNNNNLSGNANKAINNAATGTLAATCNWYGTNVSATVAGMISGSVTYDPYLVTSAGPCGFPVRVYDNTETTLLSSHVTIQAGINAAVAGNVIRVDAGTYTESLYIDKALTILGPNATVSPNGGSRLAEAIIDLSVGSRMINLHANNITFKGFEIKNSANAGAMMAGGFSQCILVSDITIEKNYFHDLNGCAIVANNGWSLVTSKWTVTDNKINATTFGTYYGGGYGSGIKIWGGSNCSITNNVLSNIGFTGIDIAMMQTATISGNSLTTIADNGIQVVSTNSNVTISNNTITNANYPSATLGQGGIKLFGSPTNLSVTGNTVTGCGSAFAVQSGNNATGAAVNSNNFAGNTYGVYHAGTGTLNATCNWYGTTVPATLAAMISGPVTYSPYKYSINGICPPPTPATTIGTPINVSCGVYDVDVKVSNFTEVGAVSLVLNYNASVLGTPTFSTTNGLEADLTSVPNQVRIAYFGDAKTLADNAVLFTLHFVLPPTLTGATTSLTWSTVSGDCEYAGPGGDPIYTSTFTDLTAWAIPARPVVNTNTLLEYCTIQAAISDPATNNLVGDHDVITVDGVLYAAKEQVIVNKEVTIQGINGQPTVELLGTVTGKPTLFDVSANNVTIDNIHFNVDLAKLRSAIVATSAGLDNIIITNNVIDCYGTPAGSYGERNAVSVNYAAYRVATGGVDNITFTGNTVNAGTYPIMFRSGISVDEGEGTFSGNTLKTINQDILVRFAASGNVTVVGNHSNGGGMEFTDFNAGTGTLSVTGNFFNGTFANTYSNALRLKNNYTGRTTVVSGNDFTGFEGNVAGYGGTLSLENYQAVTLDANTFTPLAGSTVYRHLTINTKEFSSSSGFYAPVIGATFTNNIFNGSGVLGGTALAFYNWDNDAPTFNAITIGTAGNENIFNNDIQKFIMLDNSTGTVAPNGTTMVPWAVNLNAEHNKFAMSPPTLPSAMTLAELFSLEDKIQHKIDVSTLGFVTVVANNDYVTPLSFLAPATTTPLIQRGVNAAGTPGWTVNVKAGSYAENIEINKAITLNGPNAGITGNGSRVSEAVIQFPVGAADETGLIYVGSNISGVTIAGFDLECQDATIASGLFGHYLILTEKVNNLTIRNNRMYSSVIPMYILTNDFNDHRTGLLVEGNYVDCGPNVNNGYNRGIYVQATSGTIQDNQFMNTNTGIQYMPYGHTTSGLIQRNTITAGSRGLYHNYQTNGAAQVTWSQNEVSVAPNDRLGLKAQVYGAWTTDMLTFRGMDATTFGTQGSGAAPQVSFNNNKVDGNIGSSPYYTSTIGYRTSDALATGIATLTGNSFTNLDKGGVNNSSVAVAATCNWWGTTAPATVTGLISGSVTYIPWLTSGIDGDPITLGFQPSVACVSCAITLDETHVDLACPLVHNGSINLTVNGAVSPLAYIWSGPGTFSSTDEDLTGLDVGTYYVTVTADNGCTQTISVVIGLSDQAAPVITPSSGGSTVECLSAATLPTPPAGTDHCGTTITPVLFSTVDLPSTLTCEGTRKYTFTYTDYQPKTTNWVYTYTIKHSTYPTEFGTPVANASTVECVTSATQPTPAMLPVVQDVCGNVLTTGAPTKQLSFTDKFNAPVTLGAGGWYTDRYNPAAFTSPVVMGGDNRLMHSISVADGLTSRPPAYQSAFYNTQGRGHDLGAATNAMEVKLYIPADWATTNKRMAGLWGVAVDVSNVISGYPIIEFTSDGNNPRFRAYETGTGAWINMGLPSGFAYDSWVTLKIKLLPSGEFLYNAGSLSCMTTTGAPDASKRIKSVILQGHNYDPANPNNGVTYDIYWDDFTYNDTYAPVTCEGAISYTYDYADCSGLPYSWVYTYTIDHVTAPVVPADGELTVECLASATTPTPPTVVDVCGLSVPAVLVSTVDSPEPIVCEGTRTYNYTYTDCSGLVSNWKYIYTIDRVTNPSEFGTPVSQSGGTVECMASATAPATLPVVKDICGNILSPLTPPTTGGSYAGCEGTYTYTYNYKDCANLPFAWTYTYTIDHTTPPVVPANGAKTVSCPSNAVDPTLVPTIVDQQQIQVAANPNWTDFTSIGQSFTCGTAGWLTKLDLKVGSIVTAQNFTLQIYQGNGISGSLVYSGNHSLSATGWQSLNIPQNLAPYLAAGTQYTFWLTAFTYNQLGLLCMTPDVYSGGVAMDGCASGCSPTYAWQQWPAYDLVFKTYMTVVPVVTDVCGVVIPAPTPVQSGTYDGCEGTKVYTYNYADCSGLSTPWVYTYTIDYSGGLTPPANATATVSCPSQAVDPGQPAAIMDACGRTVNAILVTPAPTLPECNGTVIWRYRYTDCDGTTTADWTKTYSVTYSGGLTPPTPSIATVSCPSSATDPGAPASITDACGRTVNAVFVSSVSSPASLTCNGSVIWLYRYYGCDGTFTADWAKTYTVLYSGGLTPPTSGALTVSCPAAAVDPGNPGSITDACGRTVNAVLVGSTTPPLCNGQVVWTYRYTACDNSTADWTFTYSILYSGGLTPPANGFATVAGPAQAVDPGPPATITDACGRNVVPTLVGSSTPPACEGSVVWTYRYTACDGTTTADWTFTYTITKSTISGTVSYYNTANTPLNGLIVDLKQGASVIGTATTNSTGGYAISGICPGTYDVVISSDITPVGGINATDAALVNSWSVSPYSIEKVKFYAGDAIMTNYLAPNDATRILKHFTSSLPWSNRGNWSFWPVGDMISENPASPPVSIAIPQIVVTGSMTQNFYGLITGDFNSSYVPGSKSSLQSLTLNYDQVKEVELGKEYELPVNAGTTMEVGAVSLIMNFPADKLEVLGVYFGDNVNNPVEYAVNGNEIRIGWQSLDPVSLKVDEQLLTLKVRAIGSLDKDETIRFSLNADPLNELADGSYNTINGAVLKMAEMGAKALGTGEIPLASGLTLVNYPNPFIGTTTIAYTLPYDGKVSLEINNALGSKVKILVDEVQTAGDHTLTVNANELKPGVYTATLRLITSDALLNRTIKIVRNQ